MPYKTLLTSFDSVKEFIKTYKDTDLDNAINKIK